MHFNMLPSSQRASVRFTAAGRALSPGFAARAPFPPGSPARFKVAANRGRGRFRTQPDARGTKHVTHQASELAAETLELACPRCRASLLPTQTGLWCDGCGASYPIINGTPILLSPDNPLFSADAVTPESSGQSSGLVRKLSKWLPQPSLNLGWRRMLRRLPELLGHPGKMRCLVIGAGDDVTLNRGLRTQFAEVTVTDVVLGPDVQFVCDGHQLPFPDDSFDCVIAAAVLEHVLEPVRVVEEIVRVLHSDGNFIADAPFMQQVHMGAYDFTRFTERGYRWLFRGFEEVESGISAGPGSMLCWAMMYFFVSFCGTRRQTLFAKAIARLLFFWLKYFDYVLNSRKGAMDSAGGFYFVGRNKKTPCYSPKRLIEDYRGCIR